MKKSEIESAKERYKRNLIGQWGPEDLTAPGQFSFIFHPNGKGEEVYQSTVFSEPEIEEFSWKENKEYSILIKYGKNDVWTSLDYKIEIFDEPYHRGIYVSFKYGIIDLSLHLVE